MAPDLRVKVFGLNVTRPYQMSVAEVLRRARTYLARPVSHRLIGCLEN